jgi:type I restriction enzyme M protein
MISQKKGIFHTDNILADTLKELILKHKPDLQEVYDPTCGVCSLLQKFDINIKKFGQEIEEDFVKTGEQNLNFTNCEILCGDVLVDDKFKGKQFDAVISNPPFSVTWDPSKAKNDERFKDFPDLPPKSKADFAFIIHCLSKVKDNGVFASLCFPGVLYRGNNERKIRKRLIEMNVIEEVIECPPKMFTDTAIQTNILVFLKNRKNKNILFKNIQNNSEKSVEIEEIIKNDYNLTVSCYICEHITKEVIDIKKLTAEVEALAARNDVARKKASEICKELFETLKK